jgi:hypothetical protein
MNSIDPLLHRTIENALIVSFNKRKSFGFAQTESGERIFLHQCKCRHVRLKGDMPFISGSLCHESASVGESIKFLRSPIQNGNSAESDGWVHGSHWPEQGIMEEPVHARKMHMKKGPTRTNGVVMSDFNSGIVSKSLAVSEPVEGVETSLGDELEALARGVNGQNHGKRERHFGTPSRRYQERRF